MSDTPKKASKRKSKKPGKKADKNAAAPDADVKPEAVVKEDINVPAADELDEAFAATASVTPEQAGDELDETSALDMSGTSEQDGDELDQTATLDVAANTGQEDEALDETATMKRPTIDTDAQASSTDKPVRKKRWRRLGWTIVIIIVLAAIGSAYLMWKQQGAQRFAIATDSDIAALRSDLQDTEAALAELQQEVAVIRDENEKFQRQISSFANEVNKRLQTVESQGARVASLEGAVASIQGISQGSRNTWLLAEAEYYLQIANAQLNLAGNPGHALLALKLADERVRELADPAFTEVRRALADEIQTLETFSKVDIEGISLTLASLSRVVDSLPIQEQFIEAETESAPEESADDLSGLDRAGAAVRNALKGVVSVRRVDEQARPLLAPEAQYFLRANLALQFQAARLALLRGEKTSFEQSLEDASTWMQDHFVADSAPVVSALATIEDIRNTTLDVEYPDISESLTLLRQQRTLASDAQ